MQNTRMSKYEYYFCLINIEELKMTLEMRTLKYLEFDEGLLKTKLQHASSPWLFSEDNMLFCNNTELHNALIFNRVGQSLQRCFIHV